MPGFDRLHKAPRTLNILELDDGDGVPVFIPEPLDGVVLPGQLPYDPSDVLLREVLPAECYHNKICCVIRDG